MCVVSVLCVSLTNALPSAWPEEPLGARFANVFTECLRRWMRAGQVNALAPWGDAALALY